MAKLVPTSDLVRDRNYDLAGDYYTVAGQTAYGASGEKIGTVRESLTEDGGKLRYLVVEVGGWFSSKAVALPVGQARLEDDGVYFDSLSKGQVGAMSEYHVGQDYHDEAQVADLRVLKGVGAAPAAAMTSVDYDTDEAMFKAPTKLQLLEERLSVNKERYQAGSMQIGKHVETRQEQVNVALQREEIVIERTAVTEARPVQGNVTLGAASETIKLDLEAERANVQKQAYVTEEIGIGKKTVTDTQTVTETVGREVLDVNKTGEVVIDGDAAAKTTKS